MTSFVNFSNHPSARWSESQLAEAMHYGEVRDIQFPAVAPSLDEREIICLAEQWANKILQMNPVAVMCQGEFSLCFAVTQLLQTKGIPVFCACSQRAESKAEFAFVRFRKYTVVRRADYAESP